MGCALPLRGAGPADAPAPKVIAQEWNFFYQTLPTKQGPRLVWVQVKQQMPAGDDPAESFPKDQQIIYELWEQALAGQAKEPLWRLTVPRPPGPTWRSVAAKCLYDQSADAYYLFLCHESQNGEFYIFKVCRGASQFMSFHNLSKAPAYRNRSRGPLKSWTFERGWWNRFHVELTYYFDSPPTSDRFDIPVDLIP